MGVGAVPLAQKKDRILFLPTGKICS